MPRYWEINVGGKMFSTYDTTLTSRPSRLKDCVDRTIEVPSDKHGLLFFDRDPKHFRLILNFFIYHGDVELPEDIKELREILKEAQFFRVHGMPEMVEKKMAEVDKGYQVLKNSTELLDVLMKANKDVAVIVAPFDQDTIRQFSTIKIKNFIKKYKNHVEFVMEDVQESFIISDVTAIIPAKKSLVGMFSQFFGCLKISQTYTKKSANWTLQLFPHSGRQDELRLIRSDFFDFIREADLWLSGIYHLE